MIRATSILPAGSWAGAPADSVLLDFEARHRRRLAMSGRGGVAFLLDLPVAFGLRQGDGLLLEDGRIVAVEAAAEPLLDVSASGEPELLRIAWHLGNRQLPTQLMGDHLRLRPDPAVEAMLAELGATVRPVNAPFDPEDVSDDQNNPWAGFGRQGFGDGQNFSQGQGFAQGHDFSQGHGNSHHNGPAFSQAHSHAHASSHSRRSSTQSESHSHSPGQDHHDNGKAHDPPLDDSQPRQG